MSTYGAYRDEAAYALAYLVSTSADVAMATQLEQMLGCRDIVLTSLQQQYRLATGVAGVSSLQLPTVEANPTAALATVVKQIPMVGPRHAPTDVLAPADDAFVRAWQHTARSCLLAADVLDTTNEWRPDPDAAWAVVADVASATSALTVLDNDLASLADQADEHGTGRLLHSTASTGIGLLARLTADVARRSRLHPDVDRLARPSRGMVEAQPLNEFLEASDGQRRVAAMLRQRGNIVPSKALGPLLVGLARIAAAIAAAAASLQSLRDQGASLDGHQREIAAALSTTARRRAEALTAMARSRKGVADLLRGGESVVWQTGEVLRVLGRRPTPADRDAAELQLRELQHLGERGDTIAGALAHGVVKAFATGHYFVPDPSANRLQWRPCRDGSPPLRDAAEDLARDLKRAALPHPVPARTRPSLAVGTPSATEQLTEALAARTPSRPPSPGMKSRQPLSP